MSLIQFNNVSLHFGHAPLLDGVNFSIHKGQRIGLLGRNGEGKSTLLKLIAKELQPDNGNIKYQPKLIIARLQQAVPTDETGSVFDVTAKGLGDMARPIIDYHNLASKPHLNENELAQLTHCQQALDNLHAWDKISQIEAVLSKMNLPVNAAINSLSGGMKRRALLAQCLITKPDVLLLDEPTNHLDIESINWLEAFLKDYGGAFVLVSHDRRFLKAVTNHIVDIDRGKLFEFSCNYETYLEKKEAILANEEKENREFDKKLAKEEVWIRQGIKARRTRNEGRVRKLQALRLERSARREQKGNMAFNAEKIEQSGKLVFSANELSFCYDDDFIIDNFSALVASGDKIGLVGPNGTGKSTLLKLLLGKLKPTSGSIRQGTNLKVAYFDQMTQGFDEDKSAVDNVGEGSQTVNIFGEEKHIIGYLQQFLFSPERAKSPVKYFSGGEKNRLTLAKLLTKNANLFVLDEPTNDLDIESLEVLETFLVDYPGTLIIVSHDRAFLDNVVTTTWGYMGKGQFHEFVGGFSDYQKALDEKTTPSPEKSGSPPIKKQNTLNREQQKKLNKVTKQIETLEKKIEKVQEELANADLYLDENKVKLDNLTTTLKDLEAMLEEAFLEWESLEA